MTLANGETVSSPDGFRKTDDCFLLLRSKSKGDSLIAINVDQFPGGDISWHQFIEGGNTFNEIPLYLHQEYSAKYHHAMVLINYSSRHIEGVPVTLNYKVVAKDHTLYPGLSYFEFISTFQVNEGRVIKRVLWEGDGVVVSGEMLGPAGVEDEGDEEFVDGDEEFVDGEDEEEDEGD